MIEEIRELMHAEPFTPFRVTLTSGTVVDVTNPDLVALGKTQITIYESKTDRWKMLRINQIAALESLSAA